KNASFERCDLGLGPGVVKGAYAQLPKYLADADRVQDLETALARTSVQSRGRARDASRVVHGHAAGRYRGRRKEESVRRPGPEVRPRGARRLRRGRIAWGEK